MPVAVGVGLEEDGTRRMFGCVSGNSEGGGEIGEVEDGFREEEAFEGVEGGLARRRPIPGEVLLGEVEEGTRDVGVVGDEPTVEVGESEERADIFYLSRRRPVCDAVELDGVHSQLAGFHDHSKVFHLVGGELALFEFQVKVKFGHALKNAFRALLVEGDVGGVDKEVIHVDDEPPFGNHIAEGVVHETLEGGRGVGESEEHHRGFEKSFVSDEGRLPLVAILDADIVISPPNIEFGEDLGVS